MMTLNDDVISDCQTKFEYDSSLAIVDSLLMNKTPVGMGSFFIQSRKHATVMSSFSINLQLFIKYLKLTLVFI